MKIGIIVYSQTGNTLLVSERLENRLKNKNHEVTVEKIQVENEKAPTKLVYSPNLQQYDVVILGAPVQAFGLAPAMKTYLQQMESLENKKVFIFVTQHFKKAWLGGNGALKKMNQLCQLKGGKAQGKMDIHWSSDQRDAQIEAVVTAVETFVSNL